MTFASHKVETEVVLVSNLGQAESSNAITISVGDSLSYAVTFTPENLNRIAPQGAISEITLDVKTPSSTLDVTVRAVSRSRRHQQYRYSGSVATAGLQNLYPGSRRGQSTATWNLFLVGLPIQPSTFTSKPRVRAPWNWPGRPVQQRMVMGTRGGDYQIRRNQGVPRSLSQGLTCPVTRK